MRKVLHAAIVTALLISAAPGQDRSLRHWVPPHVTKSGKFIAGHFIESKSKKPKDPTTGVDHWVPGHLGKDGKYVPGHMVKGRKPYKPAGTPDSPGLPVTPPKSTTPPSAYPEIPSAARVFVTRTGKTYHRQNCPHIKGRATVIPMNASEARAKGYKACKTCHPD